MCIRDSSNNMLQRCLWSNCRLSRPRFLRDCNCVVIELTAPPVFRRVRTVSGGCYMPLMAYCAVEEVKTGMRRSAIKVNTFRTGAFSSLCRGACNTAVDHSLLRVWVVSFPNDKILTVAVDALKSWKVHFPQHNSAKPRPAKLGNSFSAPYSCQEEADPIRCRVMD